MRNFSSLVAVAASLLLILSSCTRNNVRLSGNVLCAPKSGKIAVKTLGPSTEALSSGAADAVGLFLRDSVVLGEDGSFVYGTSVPEGRPEFFYLCDSTRVLAFLLLKAGDDVKVQCKAPGDWSVEGSEDCTKLLENEKAFSAFISRSKITSADYLAYYRKVVKFVLTNKYSLTVVPELMRKVGGTSLFMNNLEFPIFAVTADSLATVYPESPYVGMLRREVDRRRDSEKIQSMLDKANEALFPELVLPDLKSDKLSLVATVNAADSLKPGAPVLLIFWNSSDAAAKMFNKDVLEPLYEEYASAGLQIYQVDVSGDKTLWAGVMKAQKLPWKNVCDISGKSVMLYGLQKLPSAFVLHKSAPLLQLQQFDEASLRKALR